MRKQLRVTRNKDGSLTVKVNRYIESVDPRHLSRDELVDRVKWIAVTGGLSLEQETVRDMLRANGMLA